MKKMISLLIVLSFCLTTFTGCSTKIEVFSSANKIEITKHCITSDSDYILSATVEDDEQIKYICDNLNSLTMKKMMGYHKLPDMEHTLTFYSAGKEIQTISVSTHGFLDYNGDFYEIVNGKFDAEYIDSLLKDVTPNNGDTATNTSNTFEYSAGETAVLTVLSTKNLSKRYQHWHTNPADYSTDEARIKELIDIIDKQTWAPLSSDHVSIMQQDASLKLVRTLISEKNNSTPCNVGETANIVYFFDLEQGTVLMVYEALSTDMWDRYCTLNEEDISTIIEIFYYYRSLHLE